MARETILVTGGTGKTGGRVARRLVELGHAVRVASRSGGAVAGASSVRFDWSDVASHEQALAGVDRVYLMAPVGSPDPYPVMAAFIDRALSSGVRRFVLLSASSLPEGGPAMGMVHRLLRQAAPEWAVLRPTWFMQNFSEQQHRATIREEGTVYSATGEGRVPFVDADDIAEVGVRALVDQEAHDTDHVITGPEALTYGQAAAIIAEVLGRPVRHVNMPEDALAQRFVEQGMEPAYARILAGMDTAIAGGSEDRTTDTVLRVTGRPPRSLEAFARSAVKAWER
ncbi:ergot alkaloid biosynthesis protein [Sorangium sp. So ce269]